MLIYIVVTIAILSVLMAFWSLKKQNEFKEVAKIKKELQRKKVIFQRDSSR